MGRRCPNHDRRLTTDATGCLHCPTCTGGRSMTPQLPWERDRDELLAEARAVAGPEDE